MIEHPLCQSCICVWTLSLQHRGVASFTNALPPRDRLSRARRVCKALFPAPTGTIVCEKAANARALGFRTTRIGDAVKRAPEVMRRSGKRHQCVLFGTDGEPGRSELFEQCEVVLAWSEECGVPPSDEPTPPL